MINTNLTCDISKAVKVQYLDGNLFSQDVKANTINVSVMDNGEPATISGTVSANIIRADGGTVAATGGTISGNVASITLPAAAYAIPGVVSIIVKLTASGVTTSIAAVVANVYESSTATAVDPGTIIPSIQTLIAAIDTAVASIPADYSALWTRLAPAFDSANTYAAGDYVTYNGYLWRFITTHTGSWVAGDANNVTVGGELAKANSALSFISEPSDTLVYPSEFTDKSTGVTYTLDAATGEITVTNSGTSTYACLQTNTILGSRLVPGRIYRLHAKGETVSGSPYIAVGIRGTQDGANSSYAIAKLTENNRTEAIIDFVASQYNKRITLYMSFGTSTSGSVAKFSEIYLEDLYATAKDVDARFDTSNILTEIGMEYVTLTDPVLRQYINTGSDVTTISTTPVVAESVKYCYAIVPCVAGDMFTITGQGGTAGRLWSWIDSSYRIITRSGTSVAANGLQITAPSEAAYLVVDSIGGGVVYKSERVKNGMQSFHTVEKQVLYKVKTADMEVGSYSGTSGKSENNTRLRLRVPYYVQKGTVITASIGDLLWYAWELSSESTTGGNTIASKPWENEPYYVVKHDCYIMLSVRNKASSTISLSDFNDCDIEFRCNVTNELCAWDRTRKITKDYFRYGGFSTSDGYTDTTKRVRLGDTIFCEKGTIINFSIGSLYWAVWELSSETWQSASDVIVARAWRGDENSYEVKNDCYIMIAIANGATEASSTAIYVQDIGDGYAQIVKPIGGNITTLVENYTMLDDTTVQSKLQNYSAQMVGKSVIESFMFFTDSHWMNDATWKYEFASAIAMLGGVYEAAPVDFCIYGGDALSGTSPYNQMTKEMAMYYLTLHDQVCRRTFGYDAYYPMIGNHDFNYQANDELTQQDLVNAWFRKQGKAYYSIKGNNTTIYCLDTGKNKTSGGSYRVPMDDYKWEQIAWLGNALLTDDPAHSIIAMHIIRNNDSGQPEFQMYTEANELCAAYNARTTITKNGVTYDFSSCTGMVEMFLGGHLHGDNFYGIKNGIAYITRTTAKNTISPTFDLVLCDWENRTATFERFGTGENVVFDLTTGEPVVDAEEQ